MSSVPKRFSMGWFIAGALLQVVVPLFCIKTFFPEVWKWQTGAPLLTKITVFVLMVVLLCIFEWFFHRYILHRIVIPLLSWMARSHRAHHAACYIRTVFDRDRNGRIIINRYPIDSPEQYQNSSFPVYAIGAFCLLFTPLLWGAQTLMPKLPVYLCGYSAIIFSMSCYEIVHAIEHLPYKQWKRLTEHKTDGAFWRRLYGHHHMHHFFPQYNENIAGAFLFPLADILFRTYCRTINLLLDGNLATIENYVEPTPRRWVLWLDKKAMAIETYINHRRTALPAAPSDL